MTRILLDVPNFGLLESWNMNQQALLGGWGLSVSGECRDRGQGCLDKKQRQRKVHLGGLTWYMYQLARCWQFITWAVKTSKYQLQINKSCKCECTRRGLKY